MSLMLPQQTFQAPDTSADAAGTAAALPQAGQRAPEEEQPVPARGTPAVLRPPAPFAAVPGAAIGLAPAAAGHSASIGPGKQRTPAELRHSRAKVLSWLDQSDSTGRRHLSDDGPCDAIPAVHAPAPQPAAAQRACQPGDSWRPPQPQRAAAPLLRSPTQRLAPGDYSAQLQWAGTPRKLLLARPACQGCGQAGAACSCPALRLLRPRQPAHTSPGRHSGSSSGQHAKQPEQCSMASTGSAAAGPASAGQAACVSIATIQNAYFGDAGMLQRGIAAGAAATVEQPVAAPSLAQLPPPLPAGPTVSGGGAGMPQLDVWAAYLAARRQAAAEAAAGCAPAPGKSGCGPLAELRGMAQRIRAMQGHISSFLMRQHGGPDGADRAPTQSALGGGGSKQWESSGAEPLAPAPPTAAAQLVQGATASADQRDAGSLFTDDFILSMQLGTDWRQLERAAQQAAAGRSGSWGRDATGMGELGGRCGSAAGGGGEALQRLKQAQRVVTAERVGRQVRRAA